jgi:prepilin-type N-terminal cleavage/methylation domain-containing protein
MRRTLFRNDEGFSLSELLVVLALMGLVLAGSWALFRLTSIGVTQSNQQAWISREIGQPLERLERSFSQQSPPILEIGPYVCKIRTDSDRDNFFEVHRYEATTDGKLVEAYYEENGIPSYVYTAQMRKLSDFNSNRATNTPLFTYLDSAGKDISGTGAVNIQQTASSIVVTVVTVHEGKQYSDSRQIYFRNK